MEEASVPRKPSVYFYRGWWVTKTGCADGPPRKLIQGKGKSDRESKRQAEEELRKLLVARDERRVQVLPVSQLTVRALVEKFLDRVKVERSQHTYADYRNELGKLVGGFPWLYQKRMKRADVGERWVKGEPFTEGVGDLRAVELTPLAAEEFRNALAGRYGPKTVNHWLIACKACWNWAVAKELLAANTFENDMISANTYSGLPMLFTEDRQRVLSNEEFQKLWDKSDDVFRDVLLFLRLTPARPSVVRELTWDMIDWHTSLVVKHHTKKSRTAKVREPWRIPLVPEVVAMLRRRLGRRGDSPFVFLNEDGAGWTKDALVLRMRRLRERAGVRPDARGEQVVLYTNRHTFLTMAAPLLSAPMLGAIADHSDPGRPGATCTTRRRTCSRPG
jgi:integrase